MMLNLAISSVTSHLDLLNPLFSSIFIPHGHCYLWKPGLVGLHFLSDLVIAIAYYSIPFNLFSFVRQRKDLPFNWVLMLFGAFIVACGTTHLLEIWTLWHPVYWLSGFVKAITAITSFAAATVLVPLVPKAVALPSHALLEATNRELAREIGERKKSEARYRAIVEDQTELIARFQADGTLVFLNGAYCRYFGVNQDDLIGKKYEPVVYEADRNKVTQLVASLSAENPVVTIENRVVVAGEVRWTQWKNRRLYDETEQFLEFQAVGRDITTQKQTEEQLRQTNRQLELVNAELAYATRLKDEFLANMSHELRTPLTSILGMSEMLQEELYGELNEKQHQYIEVINQNGKHLLSLINDILDLAKIESGKLVLQFKPSSVQELCSSSLSFVKQVAHKKRIRIVTLISPDVGQINVDELRIRQALINLLSNAVKFTPEGGQVTLEVKHDPAQQIIQFSVTDTGIGIASKDMPKLFQSFVQIDSSLNRQYGGTGLGLALVRKIVEMHQGSVAVESTLGEGSRFTITLPNHSMFNDLQTPINPTEPELQLGQVDSDTATPATAQFLVLLAEDNRANIDTFSAYLTAQGCRLLVATDGQEAVFLAREHRPDVILMDIQMPRMSGLEAIRRIRSISGLENTPIIALTALAMSGDRERCLAAGANEYLTKPVRLKRLLETILQLCEQDEQQKRMNQKKIVAKLDGYS